MQREEPRSSGARSTRISVAMTTYNGGAHVALQLASMALQTRCPDEIVIGDDGSNDETALVVERFARTQTIRVDWQVNATRLGCSQNLERVVARCSGDIVVFADQDDIWLPRRLERLEAVLLDPAADAAFSDGFLMDERGNATAGTLFGWLRLGDSERATFDEGAGLDVLLKRNVVVGATLAVRRATLMRLLPFEPGWVHDYYLALALCALGRLVPIEEPLIRYRRHSQQQVGIADASWSAAVALARRQSAERSRQESDNFERLRARLIELGVPRRLPTLEALSGKARFLLRRAEMRDSRRRAPRLIWGCLRDGAYRRYSAGWTQVVLDLIALGTGRERHTD